MVARAAAFVLACAAVGCAHAPRLSLATKMRLEADTHLWDGSDASNAEANDWVVRVVPKSGAPCSGALVAPGVVVTAQHCVVHPHDDAWAYAPGDLLVELGGDYLPWGRVGVVANITCPCWDHGARGDVAALVLERKLEGVPMRNTRLATAPREGEQLVASGFGTRTGHRLMPDTSWVVSSVTRTDREGATTSVAYGSFVLSGLSQPGDSGGPVLAVDTGEVIGVVSRGTESEGEKQLGGPSRAAYTVASRLDTCAGVVERARAISDGSWRRASRSIACQ
jgi:hypothetical protein